MRAGWVDALLLPAPTQVAQSLWEDRCAARARPAGRRPRRSLRRAARRARRSARGLARRDAPLPRRCDRALRPLVIGSQAVPIPVIAPLIVLVLGFGLAPKILIVALVCFFPVDDQPRRRAARRRPRRAQAAALAATPRAGRRCASSRRPSALPAAFTGAEGRRRGRGDRRRVRGVGGLGLRARPPAADRQRAARDRARVRRHAAAVRRGRRALRRCSPRSSGASSTWAPRPRMRRLLVAARAAGARRSPAAARRPSRAAARPPSRSRSRSCSTTSRTPTTPGIYAAQAAGALRQAPGST